MKCHLKFFKPDRQVPVWATCYRTAAIGQKVYTYNIYHNRIYQTDCSPGHFKPFYLRDRFAINPSYDKTTTLPFLLPTAMYTWMHMPCRVDFPAMDAIEPLTKFKGSARYDNCTLPNAFDGVATPSPRWLFLIHVLT